MKFLNSRPKKIIFWTLTSIFLFVALVIVFISPLCKYLIEKYDMKILGREVELQRAYVNPFTGYIYLSDLRVHEQQGDSLALRAEGLSCNFAMLKLLRRTYEISSIELDSPVIRVIQNKKSFSFDDIVAHFSNKDTLPEPPDTLSEPTHFNMLNMRINNGTFYYVEEAIPVHYNIRHVNISSDGLRWDSDTLRTSYSFESGVGRGGTMEGRFDMNLSTLNYRLEDLVKKFDLAVLEQYVKDISNYGRLLATLDANIVAVGNFKAADSLNASGPLAINDFHLGRSAGDDFLAFKKLAVDIVHLNPGAKIYKFDSIALVRPYFKYERYDYLDNLQYMFGKKGEKVTSSAANTQKVNILFQVGAYIQELAKNFFRSDYQVRRLAVYDADLLYNDYALTEKFSVSVTPLTLIADSIRRSDRWVNVKLRTDLKPYGHFAFDLSVNPRDSSDFDFSYHLWRVPMAMFNPYLVTFTSFPLDRGILEFKGSTQVRNGIVKSNNNLLVIDPRVNNRQKRNGARWLPLRVFMYLVRERGNVIDYEIPIRGDLHNPNFKFGDVILDILTNLFVKPVTVPYRTEVRQVENEIEKSLTLKWPLRKAELESSQLRFVKRIAYFLKENPANRISVQPELYTEKEKEYILFFEAKKQFYLSANGMQASALNAGDSLHIERLSVKDSSFTYFLNSHSGRNLHTVQQKCQKLVKADLVNKRLKQLADERQRIFLAYFSELGVQDRVKFEVSKNKVPFNGFSLYRINYNGEFPDEVVEAYNEINSLDDRSPRKKFKDKRSRNRRLLDRK